MSAAEHARKYRAKMRELFELGDPIGIEYFKRKAEQDRKYREKYKDDLAKRKKAAVELIKENAKNGCEQSKEKLERRRQSKLKWSAKNPEYIKDYYQDNKDKWIESARKSRAKPENKRRVLDYERQRRKEDDSFRIAQTLRSRLNAALRNDFKKSSAVRDLGCSIEEFKLYIEAKFEPWMTWDNFGVYKVGGERKWHLDHIKPLASFDLTDDEQLKEAVNYKNYQPLCAIENIKKGAKIT